MPQHARTSVRAAVKSQLSAALGGIKVYASRPRPIGLKSPGGVVEIFTPREISDRQGQCGNEYERVIDVHVVGYHAGLDDEETTAEADLLSLKIETAIHADLTLGGSVQDIWLVSTDLNLDAAAYCNANFAQTWKAQVNTSLADMNI